MLNKRTCCLFVVILFLASCRLPRVKTPDTFPKHRGDPILKRVESNISKGEEMLNNGDISGSKYFFDRAVNILLDSNTDHSLTGKPLLQVVDRIASAELRALMENQPNDMERHQSFLREVIDTPLFTPTESDINRLQQKLNQEKPQYSFPVKINSKVVSFLVAFQTVRKESIQNALNRSTGFRESFQRIFEEFQLPVDLIFLPIIESGFRSDALSRAGARGIWQFMASTARMFGLRVDWQVDERLDPFKSTIAAAKYLKSLYDEYGDWFLVLACYNGGTRRVNRAIQHLKTGDFFAISQTRYLRRETRNYVPAFMASLIIAKSHREYGFSLTETASPFSETKLVNIPSPVSIKSVSGLLDIPEETIKALNPELLHDFTPFDRSVYTIRLPHHAEENLLAGMERLPPEKAYFVGWYRVKKGDSLYKIARKFNTSVHKIKKTNKLRSSLIRPGERLLIPR